MLVFIVILASVL